MKMDFDPDLEREIDRLLKDLPELAAPPGLIARTLNAVARPAAPRWLARPWSAWPFGWRLAFLILACGALAAVFFGWRTAVAPALASVTLPWLSHWTAGAASVWNTLGALLAAVALVVRHLGTGVALASANLRPPTSVVRWRVPPCSQGPRIR